MNDPRIPPSSDGDATLAGDAGESTVRASPSDGPRWPARLGHYVMLQELGHGGMGVVCAAYDQVLDRKVAIKLLHARGDGQAQVRLVREAQALARLSHPNVVQIYEIGEWEQLAFIVMEFVDGVTLRQWLREEPRSRKAILAVFDAAGRGLAAAHAQGLVHRDFKPDNVMIRHDDRVLVMDFGLARGEVGESSEEKSEPMQFPIEVSGEIGSTLNTSRTNQLSVDLTRTGSLLGTPAYMAPEQFRGLETNAKTDQFAFCIAAWEALTGARPFAGTNVAALSLSVTHGTISAPPAGLPSWIRKHLERGLATDPAKRWPAMDALLAALRNDPTPRRLGLIAVLGLATIGAGAAFGLDLAHERAIAELRAGCEAEGRAIADDWTADDRSAIERAFLASDLGSAADTWARVQTTMDGYAQRWTELRTTACIETRVEQSRAVEEYEAMSECLDEHRITFATLVDTWHEPERRQIAGAASSAGYLPAISTCSDHALLAARVRLPEDPDMRSGVEALRHRLDRVVALGLALEYDEGLREAQAVLVDAEALGWPPLIAEARLSLSHAQRHVGRFEDAHDSTERAFVEAGAAGHDLVALQCAIELIYIAGHRLARPESGLIWSEVAKMLLGRLGLDGSLHEAHWSDNLGIVYDDLGDYEKALEAYRRGLHLYEAQLGEENLAVALSLDHLSVTHLTLDHVHDARLLIERVLKIRETLLGPEHAEVAGALDNLGAVQHGEGKYDEAIATFERSLAIWKAILGPNHIDVARPLGNIGAVSLEQGEYKRALENFEAARAILEAPGASGDNPQLAGLYGNMAMTQRHMGDLDGALVNHRRALELLERQLGPDNPRLGFTLYHYANTLALAGQHELARAQLERALAMQQSDSASTPGQVAMIRFALAKVLWELGEKQTAHEQVRIALPLLAKNDPETAEILAWQAEHE